jgi:hypothetical protein
MRTTSFKKTLANKIIRHLREWHRKLGIFAAFFLIFLSLTGIALNHTNFFSLAHQSITNDFLLNHYGIHPPKDVRFFAGKKLVVTDQFVWLKEQLLFESENPIVSMGQHQQFLLIATDTKLAIYTLQGQLVDQLNSLSGLPKNITAMSTEGNQLIIKAGAGYFQADDELLTWHKIETFVEPNWLMPQVVDNNDIAQAQTRYQSQFLNWERIIVDAHSGRIFGDFGVLFMDLVAIILILLSVSGLYIWIRYARSKR